MNKIKQRKALLITKRGLQVLICAILIVLAFPNTSGFKYEFSQSSTWKHESLISSIDFPIKKSEKELKEDRKQVYYFSIEFLMGRLMSSNLLNLGIREVCEEGLDEGSEGVCFR